VKKMEEGDFVRTVLMRDPPFQEWLRQILGDRRGEAPYELLRAWRALFGVADRVPYETCALVELVNPFGAPFGFYLRTAGGRVLVFAQAETRRVTMYHPTELAHTEWYGWRDTRAWPWPDSFRFVPDWYARLPKDVLNTIFKTYISYGLRELVALYRAPISKQWMEHWEGVNAFIRKYVDQLVTAHGKSLVGLRSPLAMWSRIIAGTERRPFTGAMAKFYARVLMRMNDGIKVNPHTSLGSFVAYRENEAEGAILITPAHLTKGAVSPGQVARWLDIKKISAK
jgi:hypothetical protein